MASGDLERGTKNRGNNSNIPSYYVETAEKRWTSWIIPMFVAVNIAVFIVVMYVNDCPKKTRGLEGSCVAKFLHRFSFQPLKENPLFGPSSDTLEKMGALKWNKVVHGHQGWRLVTCIWLHAGVIHVLTNVLSLIFIGIRLEQEFGFVRVGIIYLVSGFGGSILSALFIQQNISVGASGALFGLLGAMLSELLTNWTIYANKIAAVFTLVIIIAINLAVGLLPHVDNFRTHWRFHQWFSPRLCLATSSPVWVGRKPTFSCRCYCKIEAQGLPICILASCCSAAYYWIYFGIGNAV
ncbi:hypothetical protein OIU78_013814 [Salix suchowensis]|nr:hypothetical protein OIU78_013814 [Salix suchowensis]